MPASRVRAPVATTVARRLPLDDEAAGVRNLARRPGGRARSRRSGSTCPPRARARRRGAGRPTPGRPRRAAPCRRSTSSLGRDLGRYAVAHDGGPARQQVPEPLGGVLGPLLLHEREHAVEDDHDEHGDAELRHARPRTPAPPATQNSRAKKWTISAASRRHPGTRRGAGSTFGPSAARRAAASACVSPRTGARPPRPSRVVLSPRLQSTGPPLPVTRAVGPEHADGEGTKVPAIGPGCPARGHRRQPRVDRRPDPGPPPTRKRSPHELNHTWFADVPRADVTPVGGKGANLGARDHELAGPRPPGSTSRYAPSPAGW